VKGTAAEHIEAPRVHACRIKSLCGTGNSRAVAGQHYLVGGVVVGDDHRKPPLRDQPADLLDACGHRTHRPAAAGRRLRHQRTTRACDPKGNLVAENTGGA
jgi:hypothetical protein